MRTSPGKESGPDRAWLWPRAQKGGGHPFSSPGGLACPWLPREKPGSPGQAGAAWGAEALREPEHRVQLVLLGAPPPWFHPAPGDQLPPSPPAPTAWDASTDNGAGVTRQAGGRCWRLSGSPAPPPLCHRLPDRQLPAAPARTGTFCTGSGSARSPDRPSLSRVSRHHRQDAAAVWDRSGSDVELD